jgi:peptidyl-prolyl cis-trans isomerase B (cyclophilin B)
MKKLLLFLAVCSFSVFAATKNPVVTMETSMGPIEIELYKDKAPLSVENFLHYVKTKHYDGTIFHRVIKDFMIQGGGFAEGMKEKSTTKDPVPNEATNGLKNETGTIAMARLPAPHSATAQFFINVQDNPSLDHRNTSDSGFGYAVFGKVTSGMDVVNRIKAVRTGTIGHHGDVPMDTVLIKKVTVK